VLGEQQTEGMDGMDVNKDLQVYMILWPIVGPVSIGIMKFFALHCSK
jgi:hypothetical protein